MRFFILFLFIPAFITSYAQQLNIIPYPQQVWLTNSTFKLGTKPEIPESAINRKLTAPYDSIPGPEAYRLQVGPNNISISACTRQGHYYAGITLQQMVQYDSVSKNYYIPCCEISDYPQYPWRGMHLDVSRHFFSKPVIKEYLDRMAKLKLNVFHWHLTDDQGWRIEIKQYPKLTETGAWRIEKNGNRYGGYYTQEDIKEIVAYAAERFITIVPEIEMPGHSSAAIAAYPQLSCTPGNKTVPNTWGIKKDIYCPNEFTFLFLKDVLDEVCGLFPGPYIHLGGDEAPKRMWKKSETAQALMQQQGLKNEQQLQQYLVQQMGKHIAAKGKRAIGWGEVLKGGAADSLIAMSWIDKHAGIKAARMGNQVIMAPRFFCYFDYPHNLKDKRPAWWMTYLPLRKAYALSPTSKRLTGQQNKNIIGGQANVWTEYITNEKQLEHHVFPRLMATAEALWSSNKNYNNFKIRLHKH